MDNAHSHTSKYRTAYHFHIIYIVTGVALAMLYTSHRVGAMLSLWIQEYRTKLAIVGIWLTANYSYILLLQI